MSEQTQTLIGGKTVSEKYTINSEYDICFDGKVYIANKNLNSLCYIQLFCRLLNENEAKKSLPKIDKNVKEGIINRLEELRCEVHSVEMKEGFSEERICSTEFANAIKIIKTLSDGE